MATQSTWSATLSRSFSSPVSTASQRREDLGADLLADAREPVRALVLAGPLEQLPLDLERGARRPSRSSDRCACSVGSWLTWRIAAHRVGEQPGRAPSASSSIIASTIAVVPTLRNVATSLMLASPTITCSRRYFCGVAVRLVAGVDDRPLERGLEPDLLLEEVGPLGELERHVVGRLTPGSLAADLAGADEDLAGDEVRRDLGDDAPERHLAGHQVVLVAAVAVALAVGVVLVDDDLGAVGRARCRRRPSTRRTISSAARSNAHDLERVDALGRRDLGVGVVDVVAGAVGEHRVDQVGLDLGRR